VRILFTKTSPTHHALEVIRDDGTRERAVLETKSLMPHDLIHYAFESEAGLTRSFWGLVASGASFLALSGKDEAAMRDVPTEELSSTEMLVGALTGFLASRAQPKEFLGIVARMCEAHGRAAPAFLDEAFLGRFSARMRALLGHWRAVRHGEPMELPWP
jgi:hypothetical protein